MLTWQTDIMIAIICSRTGTGLIFTIIAIGEFETTV